jgi:hypothetical protein
MKGELTVNTRRGQGLVKHRVQRTAKKQTAGGTHVKSRKNFENISYSKHLIGIQTQLSIS